MTNNRKAKILLGIDIAFGAKETARYRVSTIVLASSTKQLAS